MQMSASSTVTIRIPSELKKRLNRLADATARSSSWLAAHALATYVDDQEWQVAKIREGQRDLRAGRTASHEDVSRWLRSWGKKRELPAP
jgi:RHH-type transcriptional regulator, rel operon repressor / antitoxin RelB